MGRISGRPSRTGGSVHFSQGTQCDENVSAACGTVDRHRCEEYHLYNPAQSNADGLHCKQYPRGGTEEEEYVAISIHSLNQFQLFGFSVSRKEYYLYFVPKRSFLCEKRLQVKGVQGSLAYIGEFKCDFFPFDNDLLSMELKDAYK